MIIHMMLILHQELIWFCLMSDTPCPDFTVECHTCSVIQLSRIPGPSSSDCLSACVSKAIAAGTSFVLLSDLIAWRPQLPTHSGQQGVSSCHLLLCESAGMHEQVSTSAYPDKVQTIGQKKIPSSSRLLSHVSWLGWPAGVWMMQRQSRDHSPTWPSNAASLKLPAHRVGGSAG